MGGQIKLELGIVLGIYLVFRGNLYSGLGSCLFPRHDIITAVTIKYSGSHFSKFKGGKK